MSDSTARTPAPPVVTPAARATLQRGIGSWGFFSLAFGSMIGVGWLTAMSGWLHAAGPLGAVLAFALGGALMVLIGLCYAELTAMLPVAGGEVAYAYKAGGVRQSFVIGWFLAFGYLSVSAFEAISVGRVIAFLWPASRWLPLYAINGYTVHASDLLLAALTTGAITAVNYVGVRTAATVQTLFTVLFGGLCLAFIGAGLLFGESDNAAPLLVGETLPAITAGIGLVLVTAPFWFVGFDTIPQAAEEATTDVTPRRMGLLIVVSIVGATLFYCGLIFAVARIAPWSATVTAPLPVAAAFESAFGTNIGRVIIVTALLGLVTSWNGFFLAGTRVLFALGRGRVAAPTLGESHPRFGTPARAVLVAGVITFAGATLGWGALVSIINVGSLCIAVAFLGVSLSLLRLRRTVPDANRPYTVPGGTLIPRLASLAAAGLLLAMVVPGSPVGLAWPLEWVILGACLALGAVAWFGSATPRDALTQRERDRLILGESPCR